MGLRTSYDASVALPAVDEIVDRRRWLPGRASGLRVVHLGCVDQRLTELRAGTGALLHEELAATASELVGVDIDGTGLGRLAELVPGRYVEGDVERLGELPLPVACDLVVAAELIEHLGAPAAFLDGLREYLARTGAEGVITTPNAYSWAHVLRFAVRRREWVHPDHRLLYSPATLHRTLSLAGLRVTRLRVHAWDRGQGARGRMLSALDRAVLRWSPLLATGLIVEVRPADGSG